MKLKPKPQAASGMFVKFNSIGDTCSGEFVEFCEGVQSKFGDEDVLHLRGKNGAMVVRCTTKLKQIVKDNLELFVPGAMVKITFTKEIDTGKGSPMKDYDVDVEPPHGSFKAPEETSATDDAIPF